MRTATACFVLVCAVFVISNPASADVFASGIRFTNPDDSPFDGNPADGTPAKIHFLLNDTASSVTIRIHNVSGDAVIHTIMQNGLSSGWHSATWDGTGSGGTGAFYVTIEATQSPYSSTAYTVYQFIATGSLGQNIYSRGVDVVRNQDHPFYGYAFTANAGGPLLRGLCLYTADGGPAGTQSGSPVLDQTLSVSDGGTLPWTSTLYAPVFATTDAEGRVYVADWNSGIVYRMDDPTSVPKRIISGLSGPAGMAAVGSGTDLKLYIAAGKQVVRANMGTDDTLTTAVEVVATLDSTVHDVAFDDEGFMYVNLRGGVGFDGDDRSWTEQYNISGTLPVTSANKVWSITWNGNASGLSVWGGPSASTADDDILYVCARGDGVDAAGPGIHEVVNLHDAFGLAHKNIFKPDDILNLGSGGGNVSSRCDVTVDAVGNLLFWENGNEEIIMLTRPSSGFSVTQTTKSSGTMVLGSTSVAEGERVPSGFRLDQNFPNPFNPATNITFTLEQAGQTLLEVYDVLGRRVAILVDEGLPAGTYQVVFDAGALRSGTYVSVLRHGGQAVTRKMVLMR